MEKGGAFSKIKKIKKEVFSQNVNILVVLVYIALVRIYTKYTKKWCRYVQIGKMQYKVWSLLLLHCSALVWVFSRTNSHAFLKKVFSRTNSHAFLKYLAENKGRPPVLIIPLNISPSPHLLIFDLNIYLVWFKIFHPTVL